MSSRNSSNDSRNVGTNFNMETKYYFGNDFFHHICLGTVYTQEPVANSNFQHYKYRHFQRYKRYVSTKRVTHVFTSQYQAYQHDVLVVP